MPRPRDWRIWAKLSSDRRNRWWVASKQTPKSTSRNETTPSTTTMAPRKAPTPESALETLRVPLSLKLLDIAETLAPKDLPQSAQKRSSAVSEDSEQNGDTHPAALEADLDHYKVSSSCNQLQSHGSSQYRNCLANYGSVTSNKSRKRNSYGA